MYICIHIYMCTHVAHDIYEYMYIHSACIYVYLHVHTYTALVIRIFIHSYIHSACIYVYKYIAFVHMYICTYIVC
jgi:hypothetical protein